MRIHTYVQIYYTIRLRPKDAKNSENCDPCDFSKQNFFEKNFSGFREFPQNGKKEENFEFYKSIENILMVILSPHWGVLGEK